MQKVRLSTAKAHILLSDTGTRAQGLALLDEHRPARAAAAGCRTSSGPSSPSARTRSPRPGDAPGREELHEPRTPPATSTTPTRS